jgi:hypothetical protein
MTKLPIVLTTSVIRASNKGEAHGGLYYVDLETNEISKKIDWDKIDINWEGRGYDRGMRGIAFHKKYIYIAISDEILVFNYNFSLVKSLKNNYLKHCHEIFIANDKLYITSTGFDSIIEYDISLGHFTKGYLFSFPFFKKYMNRFFSKKNLEISNIGLLPDLKHFDPDSDLGPSPRDNLHINSVNVRDQTIFVSGRRLCRMLAVKGNNISSFSRIPYYTHNAMPYKNWVIANSTRKNKIVIIKKNKYEYFNIPYYDIEKLINNNLPDYIARQQFGRGLCLYKNLIISGSSPATISVYIRGNPFPIKSVNISMDIRNSIHGLEIFKF